MSLTGRTPSQPNLQSLPIGSPEAMRIRSALMDKVTQPFWNYKVLKPTLTALLCAYAWGFERPQEIWMVNK